MILSPVIFSSEQVEILGKGLHFSPSSGFNLFQTILDVNRFTRLLTIKKFFADGDNENSDENVSVPIKNLISNEFSGKLFDEQLAL